jgi:biopolymer transport protein ExbB
MKTMHPRTVIAAACAALLALAGPALAESSFGTAFFVSMDRASDGEVRVDWIGSAMIWVLIGMSVASVALIWIAFASNRTEDIMPPEEAAALRRAVGEGRFAEALDASRSKGGDYGRMLHAALEAAPGGHDAMLRAAESAADELVVARLRRIEVLNVFGQVAPMIGLFGTVYGMIVAFFTIARMGGTADPVALAGGIGTALVTTFWGLLIAIPALGSFAIVRNRIDAAGAAASREVERTVARFRPADTANVRANA